jgi:hypothetical protein
MLFRRISTQWMVGSAGPAGLRYEALYPLIDRMQLPPGEWDEMFSAIQHMEAAALEAMNERD